MKSYDYTRYRVRTALIRVIRFYWNLSFESQAFRLLIAFAAESKWGTIKNRKIRRRLHLFHNMKPPIPLSLSLNAHFLCGVPQATFSKINSLANVLSFIIKTNLHAYQNDLPLLKLK